MREMKDRGVEWIGEIGADFDLIKLKNVADILDEYRKPISADVRNQEFGFIRWKTNVDDA